MKRVEDVYICSVESGHRVYLFDKKLLFFKLVEVKVKTLPVKLGSRQRSITFNLSHPNWRRWGTQNRRHCQVTWYFRQLTGELGLTIWEIAGEGPKV